MNNSVLFSHQVANSYLMGAPEDFFVTVTVRSGGESANQLMLELNSMVM